MQTVRDAMPGGWIRGAVFTALAFAVFSATSADVVRTVLLEFCFEFFQDFERFVRDDSNCPVFDAQGYFEAYGVPPGSLLARITEGQCFKALVLVSGGCGSER